jgi:hypothetical protein
MPKLKASSKSFSFTIQFSFTTKTDQRIYFSFLRKYKSEILTFITQITKIKPGKTNHVSNFNTQHDDSRQPSVN